MNNQPVKWQPEKYGTVDPYIVVRGVEKFITFLKSAFDAKLELKVPNPDGSIGHAEVRIGDSVLLMFDAQKAWPDTPAFLRIYVEDVDTTYAKALEAGATKVTELIDGFTGERGGRVCDPVGNVWWIQTRFEDVSFEEMGKRSGEQKYIDAMKIAQDTFDQEMRRRAA